jgi:hypothetical protein
MTEKSIKTISFNGYRSWEFKMKAFLRELGCADVLVRSDMDAEISDMNVRQRNDIVFTRIAMAITVEVVVRVFDSLVR